MRNVRAPGLQSPLLRLFTARASRRDRKRARRAELAMSEEARIVAEMRHNQARLRSMAS